MMLIERDPSASFAEASRYVITASRKRRLLVEDTTAAAYRIPECYNTSRKRRKISPPMQPMKTRRNRYCYQNNGRATTTTASRNSRRPASARRASDVEGVRHVPLPKKKHQQEQHMDHHDALCGHFGTEYLGVSNVAFAPSLRRYLESPQHGRHALRSSKPSSSRLSTGLLGSRIRARAASAGMEAALARRPISRSNTSWRGGASCPDIDRYGHASSCSAVLSGENHERSASLEELRSGSEQTPGTSPRHGVLIPVGPDWREHDSSPIRSDVDEPTLVRTADENTHHDADDGDRARETLSRIGESSLELGEGAICGGGRTNGIDDADSRGSRHTSQRQEEGCTRHGGDNNFRGVATEGRTSKELGVRCGSRRRRIPRSTAWDLLTGRRVQPGRRKGSCDIRLSEVSRSLSQMCISELSTPAATT